MELSKNDMKITKGAAILFMLLLHLFCRKEVNGLYETFITIKGIPLVYYLALFGDACVPMYCFASGYGLYLSNGKEPEAGTAKNFKRIFKLLLNYWIVLLLFVVIGFISGRSDLFPGSLTKFLLNFFVLSNSYNGAWWFVQTYLILVLLSPLLNRLVRKHNPYIILSISGIIYLASYIQRIKHSLYFGHNAVIGALVSSAVLVGTSQLPFLTGAVFANHKLYSIIYSKFNSFTYKNAVCLAGILILVALHAVYESLIIAPFTGIAFLCLFNVMDKSTEVQNVLSFFGNHSTNLWLTHMFFYLTIFPKITFAPGYPVLIFIWLLLLCVVSSYVINLIYKPLVSMTDKNGFRVTSNFTSVNSCN